MQRLAHQGEQDAWFTGNPVRSLFLMSDPPEETYLQNTIEVPFNNPVSYGGTGICNIPVYGDRITDITLKVVLPQLQIPITSGWVYPSNTITPPGIYIFFQNKTYSFYQANQTVTFYSTNNIQWFPSDSNLTLSTTTTNFAFSNINPSIVSFGFLKNDANFFGFDYFNASYTISVQAQTYIYVFPVTPQSLLTFEQSGWIPGNIPPPVSTTYVDTVAHALTVSASLLIGGQTIDTVTGEYMDLHRDIEVAYENQAALTVLHGKNDTSSIQAPRTYYVKLPFTNTFEIPIRDVFQYQDVQIVTRFDSFFNITPLTTQRSGFGFASSDSFIWYNYLTGDNSSGVPGTQFVFFDPGLGFTYLALNVACGVWDGQYFYLFTKVTFLDYPGAPFAPYFLVFDTHRNIVTDSGALTLTQFTDIIQGATFIGKNLYAIGLTGSLYTTPMRGPIPYTSSPISIAKVPLSYPLFSKTTALDSPAQTGVSILTIVFTNVTGIQNGLSSQLASGVYGLVVNVTGPAVTFAFQGPTDVPDIPPGTNLYFVYPVTTYTIGTDGLNIYMTTTVNDSYAGPVYSNIFVFNTATSITSNIIADVIPINFSVQPVFDGKNMWYVDKYQVPIIYAYNTQTTTWSSYNYTNILGIPQQNFSYSVFDGTNIYWFTDVTLQTSLFVQAPVAADTGNWVQYNTTTHTWSAYNWNNVAQGGFFPTVDPGIYEALFDGRYINLTSYISPIIYTYDTTLSFTSNASYSWINTATGESSFTATKSFHIPNPYGFSTIVGPMLYDGRYLTYFPYSVSQPTSNANISGFLIRYDTSPPLNPETFPASLIIKYDKLPPGTPLPNAYYISQTSLTQAQTDQFAMNSVSSGPVKEMFIVNQTPSTAPGPFSYNTQATDIHLFYNGEPALDYTSWNFVPLRYHTTMPQRNLSFINFCEYPENTDPSGTVNFSRIRDIEVRYPWTANSYTRVYTQSYNIFQVRNGIGGLVFNSPDFTAMSSIEGRWTDYYISQIFVG